MGICTLKVEEWIRKEAVQDNTSGEARATGRTIPLHACMLL